MIKSFSLFFLITLLSACASYELPPEPDITLPKNTKIAILINTSSSPKHTHIGATPFSNFVKEYDYDWDIQNNIFKVFKGALEKIQDYKVVDLRDYGLDTLEPTGLILVENNQWKYSETHSELIKELLKDNVRLVIHIDEKPTYFTSNCGAYSCITYYSEGLGLVSRSVLGVKSYYASASYNISAELLDPLYPITAQKEMRSLNNHRIKNKLLNNYKVPKMFKNITEDEFEDVKKGVLEQMNFFAMHIYYYLKSKL
ncbi:hypothetical protein C1E23_02230 [Pseudoalteromonas phenolica]|uniref:Lipoprotein n=1 Tax=Pseudoalteromonas phenolica TaxID=161398 RepID=A0A4Q7IT02_9GAMM|nr:hypothetical protein [Pseudoalteromonas phenolica]RZQ54716.1 hypothetical protein C1E23_02230 [Pseudoalteromonas phenolica]